MNRSIMRLWAVCCALFALLVATTTRWTAVEDGRLRAHPLNQRDEAWAQTRPRGVVRAADGTVLAGSYRAARVYRRRYPHGRAYAHPLGYAAIRLGTTGLERTYDKQLAAARDFDSPLGLLGARDREPESLDLSLRPAAQEAALRGLGGRAGAVIALDPVTGSVLAWASTPAFDPNAAAGPVSSLDAGPGALVDRVRQARYPPGSTFKIVTAAAALDTGAATPDTALDGSSPRQVSGTPLANAGDASLGAIPFSTAVTRSVNTAFAQLAERLGGRQIERYMRRFGFGRRPDVDMPAVRISGLRGVDGPLRADSAAVDIGRVAIGQERLLATPLQMGLVTAAVANDGVLVPARLASRVGGKPVPRRSGRRVMKPASARTLQRLLSDVVREGTGTAATLAGTDVAGKTGTAEVDIARGINDLWFVGFAPADDPEVAVAVVVERQQGLAGQVAAPIGRDVISAALGERP